MADARYTGLDDSPSVLELFDMHRERAATKDEMVAAILTLADIIQRHGRQPQANKSSVANPIDVRKG